MKNLQSPRHSLSLFTPLRLVLAAVSLLASLTAQAELRPADVFQSMMVLQREKDVPVWGWADPSAKVDISFNGQSVSTQADADGYWMAKLAPMDANANGQTLSINSGSESVELTDVLVGEVWVAAGQSNMRAGGPDKDTGHYPFYQSPGTAKAPMRIRNFGFGAVLEPTKDFPPAGRTEDAWKDLVIKDGDSIPQYFTRVLRDHLDVPVGMIVVAFSGTNQAAWMSRETLEKFPGDGGDFYQQMLKSHRDTLAKSKSSVKTWEDFEAAEQEWLANPKGRWPGKGVNAMTMVRWPSALYNTRIYPLAPYAIRGFIWHQGEGGPGGPYGERLVAMFNQWREVFGQDFYAVWGTLSRHGSSQPPLEPASSSFYRSNTNKEIRKAYELSIDDGKMDYVEFYDLGNHDTHFTEKAEAGRRMALGVLNLVYGENNVYTGPRLAESKFEGNVAYLKLDKTGEGLVYEPSIEGVSGFIISDGKNTQWGEVEVINGTTLKVSHPDVAEIKMVTYANDSNPHETLFNSDGLPGSPFTEYKDGSSNISTPKAQNSLVKVNGKTGAKLHLGHVRRDGYMFEYRLRKGEAEVPVQTYIPKEWNGFEVLIDGNPADASTTDIDGKQYASFTAPTGKWVTVCQKGKSDEFRGIDRY